MKKWVILLLLSVVVACSQPETGMKGAKNTTNTTEKDSFSKMKVVDVLAEGLEVPWSLVDRGDVFLVSERAGAIVEVPKTGGDWERQDLQLKKEVLHEGEGGFLGLALDPDNEKQDVLYAYHTYREEGKTYNRIIQLKQSGKGWKEEKALLEKIPGGFIHNGGRLAMGPDKKLYATTGDAGTEKLAQDKESLAGKILRLNPDGSIPKDNPFPGSYVYSYGHRNSQGIAWTSKGEMYNAEHGPSGRDTGKDEINQIRAGENYGWPVIQGDETRKGMRSPLYQSGNDTWAPSGMTVAEDTLYVAGLRGQQIRSFTVKGDSSEKIFQGEGRLRDILYQDGMFYVLTNNTDGRGEPGKKDDRLIRLEGDK